MVYMHTIAFTSTTFIGWWVWLVGVVWWVWLVGVTDLCIFRVRHQEVNHSFHHPRSISLSRMNSSTYNNSTLSL